MKLFYNGRCCCPNSTAILREEKLENNDVFYRCGRLRRNHKKTCYYELVRFMSWPFTLLAVYVQTEYVGGYKYLTLVQPGQSPEQIRQIAHTHINLLLQLVVGVSKLKKLLVLLSRQVHMFRTAWDFDALSIALHQNKHFLRSARQNCEI